VPRRSSQSRGELRRPLWAALPAVGRARRLGQRPRHRQRRRQQRRPAAAAVARHRRPHLRVAPSWTKWLGRSKLGGRGTRRHQASGPVRISRRIRPSKQSPKQGPAHRQSNIIRSTRIPWRSTCGTRAARSGLQGPQSAIRRWSERYQI
jgi:hypothetical protein